MTADHAINLIRAGGKPLDAGVKALYDTLAQPMLRFFVYRGLGGDEAKDVLQEVFMNIVRGAAGYSGAGSATAWVWQIARNSLTNHLRKRAGRADHEVTVDEEAWERVETTTPAPQPRAPGMSVDECVSGGLAKFSEVMPERAHVLMWQMEGVSIAEIGEHIGRSTGAAKQYLSECRKKIQPFIAHCTELLEA